MRIVVAALSAPVHLNGVSRHAANLVRGLLNSKEVSSLDVLVGAWQHQTLAAAIAKQDSRLRIHPMRIGAGTLSRNMWYLTRLPRIAAELKADILHLAYPVPFLRREVDCPAVVSLHDMYAFEVPGNFGFLKSLINRAVIRQCLCSSHAIACVSASTRQCLRHWLGERIAARAATIPNAVAPVASAIAPTKLRGGSPFVLCVAQHRLNKNIPLALRIFEHVMQKRIMPSQSRLVIVGGQGPETHKIERQIGKPLREDAVLLLAGISDAELQWCYRNCAVLLAPSIVEGFGLPVAEAMLAGCRVVCSDIPAFREVGRNRCRYVPLGEGEVNRFAEAIREVLASPRPSPTPIPWLSPETIGEKYIILYRHLLSSSAHREPACLGHDEFPRSAKAHLVERP